MYFQNTIKLIGGILMNTTQIVSSLQTVLIAILIALIGYIGKRVVEVVPKLVDLTVAKIGLAKYTKTKAIATDIFNKVNEDGRLGTLVNSKSDTFVALIRAKIPSITDEDIDLLKQSLAGEYNKDKPLVVETVKIAEQQGSPVVETPIAPIAPIINVVPVTPILKYVAPDGTELQPVNTAASI